MHSFSLILSLILPALYANIVLAIPLDSRETGSSYSGAGGQSPGGSVYDQGIVNVLSSEYHCMRLVPASEIDITVKTTQEMAD